MIGEYSGAGYANNAGELGTGSMDALLDLISMILHRNL